MKKYIFIILIGIISNLKAQEGFDYLNILYGYEISENHNQNLLVNYEFSNKSYNAYDLYYEVKNYQKEPNHYAGGGYNQKLFRNKNLMFRLRFGFEVGAENNKFIYGGGVGINATLFLYKNFGIYLLNKNNYLFNAQNEFDTNIYLGFKLPL